MLRSFIEHVLMVVISAILAMFLVYAFDVWYQDNKQRRQDKWNRKQSRQDHPANGGPRYE